MFVVKTEAAGSAERKQGLGASSACAQIMEII
jgi:hypothetical protein